MAEFFLSHAGEDAELAHALASGLRAAGLNLWCDTFPDAIPAGSTWVSALEAALSQVRGYLIIIGRSGATRWVRAELDYALNRQAIDNSIGIVPLLLPGADPETLPPFLSRFQAVRLSEDVGRETASYFAGLVAQLAATPLPRDSNAEATCPFRGLESFDEEQAKFFFGRRHQTLEAMNRLGRSGGSYRRWLHVEGPSGSGKSSFVKAGLIPAFRRCWVQDGPRQWDVAVVRPGVHPVSNLAVAVHRTIGASRLSLPDIEKRLQNPLGLRSLLREVMSDRAGFLLVVDQLEELFTVAGSANPETKAFEQLVAAALADHDLPLFLVSTMRSDFAAQFTKLEALGPKLDSGGGRYYLRPMDREGLTEAVWGPARLAGLVWDTALPERIVDEAAATVGALPLLAHALWALWDLRVGNRLTADAYLAIGHLEGALSKGADSLLASLSREQQNAARRLLLALVRTGRGTSDVSRPRRREEALAVLQLGPAGEQVLSQLSGGRDPVAPATAPASLRLLHVDDRNEVHLVHDALVVRWATLGEWIDQDRALLERRDDLEISAEAWLAAGRDSDYLPRGGRLDVLKTAQSPNAVAAEFIDAAQGLARRARLLQRAGIVTLGLVALAMTGLFAWALRSQSLAQARLSDARGVAFAVVDSIDRDLQPIAGAASVRRKLLNDATGLLDKLQSQGATDAETLRLRARAHISRGDLARSHDDLNQAEAHYREAGQLIQQLLVLAPDDPGLLRELARVYERTGIVAKERNDLKAARNAFQADLAIAQRLSASAPGDVERSRDLFLSYLSLGEVHFLEGDRQAARARYKDALNINLALAKVAPEDRRLRHDLGLTYIKLGDLDIRMREEVAARESFLQSASVCSDLVAADEARSDWKTCLATSYERLGFVAGRLKERAAARDYYERAMAIHTRLSDTDPEDTRWLRNKSTLYTRLGELAMDERDYVRASDYFRRDQEICLRLTRRDPGNMHWQRDLSVTYYRLGEAAMKAGNLSAARAALEADAKISEKLAAAEGSAENRKDLLDTLVLLVTVMQRSGTAPDIRRDYVARVCEIDRWFQSEGALRDDEELLELRRKVQSMRCAETRQDR